MSPNPKGGVTYLYDDATQSYALAFPSDCAHPCAGETLDALKEGVAAFGADGRMKLFNPALRNCGDRSGRLERPPHVDEMRAPASRYCSDPNCSMRLKAVIVDLPEHRKNRTVQIERTDGLILRLRRSAVAGRSDPR